jgi:hypothetical protein
LEAQLEEKEILQLKKHTKNKNQLGRAGFFLFPTL